MYWRRFAVSSIPYSDPKAFDEWVRARWVEKDGFIEQYLTTGRFPADDGSGEDKYLEAEVQNRYSFEWLLLFLPVMLYTLVGWTLYRVWKVISA